MDLFIARSRRMSSPLRVRGPGPLSLCHFWGKYGVSEQKQPRAANLPNFSWFDTFAPKVSLWLSLFSGTATGETQKSFTKQIPSSAQVHLWSLKFWQGLSSPFLRPGCFFFLFFLGNQLQKESLKVALEEVRAPKNWSFDWLESLIYPWGYARPVFNVNKKLPRRENPPTVWPLWKAMQLQYYQQYYQQALQAAVKLFLPGRFYPWTFGDSIQVKLNFIGVKVERE